MEVWDDRDRNSTLCDEAAGPVSEEIPAPIATLAPLMLRYTTALGLRPVALRSPPPFASSFWCIQLARACTRARPFSRPL